MKKILLRLKYVIPILSFTLLLFLPLVVRAEDVGLPVGYENYNYWVVVVYSDGSGNFYGSETPFYFHGTLYLQRTSKIEYYANYRDGVWSSIWKGTTSTNDGALLFDEKFNEVGRVYANKIMNGSICNSNHDIYSTVEYSSGYLIDSVFFKAPVILAKTAEQLIPAVQIQVEMITLVVVGCLALMVGLTILAKKLQIFLPR